MVALNREHECMPEETEVVTVPEVLEAEVVRLVVATDAEDPEPEDESRSGLPFL
jgi:hypothetical protein